MFRSPNDASSSESESESNSDDEIEVSRISTAKSVIDNAAPSTSQHVNLIAASLLEFHATVQAAEILNAANAKQGTRYDRHSPEAKVLAKKLFASRSELLASHGMLAADLNDDQDTRQQYLTGISSLGIPEALRDAGGLSATPKLALEAAGPTSFAFDVLPNIGPLAIPSLPRLPRISRYQTEFSEIKQLGRGGFGTVYHVINHVDKQPYAVKKINLDPRRLKKRWQEGGREEVENVLREIRTLASLEHTNIVRYFGAWIEGPQDSSPGVAELEGSRPPIFRRLLGETAGEAMPFNRATPRSRSRSNITPGARLGASQHENDESVSIEDGIFFGEDSASAQPGDGVTGLDATASTISLTTETDIFTDGDGRGGPSISSPGANQITLCLQMSLHQLNLAHYLSPQSPAVPAPNPFHDSIQTCHCFHLKPSLSIFLGILSGVQYLHSAGMVHRDLKPANIFLSEDSVLRPGFIDASCLTCPRQCSRYLNARIGDFGLVGNVAEELSTAASTSDKVVGTELYRPPRAQVSTPTPAREDAKGKGLAKAMNRIDEKIDVFALGVLLFELLWRFDTKAERFVVLNALTRSGSLPAGFTNIFAHATDGKAPSEDGNDARGLPCVDNTGREHGRQSPSLGDMIAECIAGMVHGDPTRRWGCARVREYAERVLRMCC
jgi:translation initiation factor 2-alpha kinase 3